MLLRFPNLYVYSSMILDGKTGRYKFSLEASVNRLARPTFTFRYGQLANDMSNIKWFTIRLCLRSDSIKAKSNPKWQVMVLIARFVS